MNKGQSLFGIVFTVGISALIIVGVVSLANQSLGNSNAARDRSLASRYVQEMTECLRKQRDANWDAFVASGANICTTGTPAQTYFENKQILFTCYDASDAEVACSSSSVVKVEADVSIGWNDGSGSHMVHTITRFTDWRRN